MEKVHTWRRGKKIITEEVIVISDTDEEVTSVKSGPVKKQPQEQVEEIPDSPPCEVLQDPYQDLQEQADKIIEQLKKEPVEEPLAEIKWEKAVRSNYSNKRINFDMKLYKGMVPTVVKKIPHNVDGLKYFIIDVPEEEAFCTKYRDGRHFELHS